MKRASGGRQSTGRSVYAVASAKKAVLSEPRLVQSDEAKKYYAVYAQDPLTHRIGSSGNAFGLCARTVLATGGEVFGAALDAACRHLRIQSAADVGLARTFSDTAKA